MTLPIFFFVGFRKICSLGYGLKPEAAHVTCPECAAKLEVSDPTHPYIIRRCPGCGRELKLLPIAGDHGIGIKFEQAGDQLVMPAGSIKISANPRDSPGYLTPAGLKWFSKMVFLGSFGNTSDEAPAYIAAELDESDKMLRESALMKGLDPDNEDDWPKLTERIELNQEADELWILYFHGFCSIASKAIEENDIKRAVWATSAAQRAKSLILFNNYFRDVVWMGHSASRLLNLLRTWDTNQNNQDEEFWQINFRENQFAFSQLFSVPVTFVAGKAYVGGMGVDHKDAKFVDFLLAGGSSKDAILIEIKVPGTRLLGSKYRSVYKPSPELAGTLVQIQEYKRSLVRDIDLITRNSSHKFSVFNPKAIILAGNFDSELDSEQKQRSFEMFRSSLSNIEIITYDEFFRKLEYLLQVFGLLRQRKSTSL